MEPPNMPGRACHQDRPFLALIISKQIEFVYEIREFHAIEWGWILYNQLIDFSSQTGVGRVWKRLSN